MARRKYADLAGEGAKLYGGRYNPLGIPAVYASASISLAALEVLVHVEKTEVPDDYVALGIDVGRGQVRPLSMKAARRVETMASGQGSSETFQQDFYGRPVLRVPSVIIPREYNYVLLPAADNFSARVLWTEPFRFDPRLFASSAES